MPLPSREARLQQLVLRGIMPSVAERVIAEAEAAGQRITPANEAAWEAEVTPADQELARLWWWYTPDVPQRLRRILDAQVMDAAPVVNYDPNQPRDPAGTSTGGQWTKQGAPVVDTPVVEPFEGGYYSERERGISFDNEMAQPERIKLIDDLKLKYEPSQGPWAIETARIEADVKVRNEIKREGQSAIANDPRLPTDSAEDGLAVGRSVQDAWASTSNDHGDYQDSLQFEAYSRSRQDVVSTSSPGLKVAAQRTDRIKKQAAVVFDNIYNRTQQYFRDHGFGPNDEVVIFRGMLLDKVNFSTLKDAPVGSAIAFKSNPLSSFSLRYDVARGFSGVKGGSDFSIVVGVRVPAKAIFAHWSTGMGCADEDEVIVLGDYLADAKLYKVAHYE